MESKQDEEFIFDNDEAVEVIWDQITNKLREKLTRKDIDFILDLKLDFMERVNIAGDSEKPRFWTCTASLDEDELNKFVIHHALNKGIQLNDNELEQIWDGEELYLEMHGITTDEISPEMN
jgi:hypothetical protein